jgi:hypothetical protein
MQLRSVTEQALSWLVDAIEMIQDADSEFEFWRPEINKLVCTIAQLPRRWYAVKVSRRKLPRDRSVIDDQIFQLRAHYRHLLADAHAWQR